MVNIRRGIVAPPVLVDINGVTELRTIKADARTFEIGAAVTLAEVAAQPDVMRQYPVVAQAAGHIAGPTHRNMGTVGGNLALDTRCIYYNQSEWWRAANHHVSRPPGRYATSRQKAAASASPPSAATSPRRCSRSMPRSTSPVLRPAPMPLADLYIGYARQDEPVTETRGDGKYFLSLRPGEVIAAVRARNTPGLRSAYDKIRIRRSIEYPVTGVAVALRRDGDKLADCASLSPAPIRGRCGLPAPPSSAAAGSTRGYSRPRRARARSDHGDEDHVHARSLPPPHGGHLGETAGAAVV